MPARCALSSASAISIAILQRQVERQRSLGPRKARGQRLAVEMRHDEKADVVRFTDVVDRADVRMVERGDGAGLAFEPRARIGIGGDLGRQDFDRDRAVEPRIAGAIDLAHAARAERRDDLRTDRGECRAQ